MKTKYKLALLLAAVAVAALVASWPWLKTEVAIDSCLDAGGRWNYGAELCEHG